MINDLNLSNQNQSFVDLHTLDSKINECVEITCMWKSRVIKNAIHCICTAKTIPNLVPKTQRRLQVKIRTIGKYDAQAVQLLSKVGLISESFSLRHKSPKKSCHITPLSSIN
jgi:hypothetical protein